MNSIQPSPFTSSDQPLYLQVKEYILQRIVSGEWLAGMKIASEAELVKVMGVSRMTVNRALRELSAEGVLFRRQGRGTYVAERKTQAGLLEITSIAHEIRERGGIHSCEVHLLAEEKAFPELAIKMGLAPYATVFHSITVHKDNGVPIQLGSRYVNPAFAPDYLKQDFTRTTPNEYLISLAQISSVEHIVEALMPDNSIRKLLQIEDTEPCLVLHRRTWVDDTIATYSTFYYPGSRYTLGSHYTPSSTDHMQVG